MCFCCLVLTEMMTLENKSVFRNGRSANNNLVSCSVYQSIKKPWIDFGGPKRPYAVALLQCSNVACYLSVCDVCM